ncbi:uncharacterized protein LOC131073517 [Cryptomeria japonica]|nr:uncharacterized protein LOC131073517 [Cryptomeria japonica]
MGKSLHTLTHGWQYQIKPATVQCIVGDALTKITKLGRKELGLVGASRTDAGVHAWGQVAHFTTPFFFDQLESLHAGLNGVLPPDIRVREVAAVKTDFHARYSALKKTYHYKIYNDAIMDPFQNLYAYHFAHKLNIDVMRQAAKYFIGQHDFSAFITMSRGGLPTDPRREIFRFDVVKMGANIQLEIEGSGFFYKQVRNMVALLLEIGKEAVPAEVVFDVLASCDRRTLARHCIIVPPQGLCLMSVTYATTDLETPPGSPTACYGRQPQISKCTLVYY